MTEHEFHYEAFPVPGTGAIVYRMHGVLGDSGHCYEFLDAFLDALESAPPRIVFNFAGLESVYSAGVGILANCFTKAREQGRELVLAHVPDTVRRTLTITGVEPMLQEYATEEEAVATTS